MDHLVDTNIMARSAIPSDPQYPVATHAVATLFARGDDLFITPIHPLNV